MEKIRVYVSQYSTGTTIDEYIYSESEMIKAVEEFKNLCEKNNIVRFSDYDVIGAINKNGYIIACYSQDGEKYHITIEKYTDTTSDKIYTDKIIEKSNISYVLNPLEVAIRNCSQENLKNLDTLDYYNKLVKIYHELKNL